MSPTIADFERLYEVAAGTAVVFAELPLLPDPVELRLFALWILDFTGSVE